MNQCLKDSVYNRGTKKQATFMAKIGGMNEEETAVFLLIHSGKKDQVIMDMMGLSRKSFERIVEAVRAKLLLAVFECINAHMDELEEQVD